MIERTESWNGDPNDSREDSELSDYLCGTCGSSLSAAGHCESCEEEPDRCSNPDGHEFAYSGTAYGGDDPSYFGEGRCYCIYCGADGDG